MTVKVAGDVGAVNAAVSAGKQTGLENQKLVSFKVIARPADSVDQIFGAAKNTKIDTPIQSSDSAELQTQAEKEDGTTGETSVKETEKIEEKSVVRSEGRSEGKSEGKTEVKLEVEPEIKLAVEPEVESADKLTVKPEAQLEEELEEKPVLVEQAAEEKPAQEPQAELQTEPQAEPEKASSITPSGAKKTAENKNKK
jgi:microcompartment protein CcmL/EutN